MEQKLISKDFELCVMFQIVYMALPYLGFLSNFNLLLLVKVKIELSSCAQGFGMGKLFEYHEILISFSPSNALGIS